MIRRFAAALVFVSVVLASERDAAACGGCFHPLETPTVVTDHRMIFSVSKDQTTLYDQIEYSGSPSSFAWVLPVAGSVEVGLGADTVFAALDKQTETTILSPVQSCPPPPSDVCPLDGGAAATPREVAPGVDVVKRDVVGPYDTVQLHPHDTTDTNALTDWLAQNGYVVTPDIEPLIATYVEAGFDFLALKLVPGASVKSMRPVRVTTKGASATLPLRMVAAGTGATVGITLWVIAEGRYEPQNFPNFVIDTNDLVWDWKALKSNYTELRAEHAAAGHGRAWEIESSVLVGPEDLRTSATVPGCDALPGDDAGAGAKTSAQVADDDMATMFHGINVPAHVTRMRADVAHAALAADLVVTASAEQSELANVRQLVHEIDPPPCITYAECPTDSNEPATCATTPGAHGRGWIVAALGVVGAALRRVSKRRNRAAH